MFNNVIKSSDDDAVIKLQENIEMLESRLTYMQSVNDYYKENKTTLGHPEVPIETAMEQSIASTNCSRSFTRSLWMRL